MMVDQSDIGYLCKRQKKQFNAKMTCRRLVFQIDIIQKYLMFEVLFD